MENDVYVRKTGGYLPEASVAFIDEIFKANSAIQNTLLTILNERSFDNGNQRHQIPLLCMVSLPQATMAILCINAVVLVLMGMLFASRYMPAVTGLKLWRQHHFALLEKMLLHTVTAHDGLLKNSNEIYTKAFS
jgi:hypothetical protein